MDPATTGGSDVGSYVEVDGARLWTVRSGASGPPVVVLHGGPGLPDYTAGLADLLPDEHLVARYDQRGSGRSDRSPPYTLARFVADLEDLRTAWSVERWHVVGHSWGATLALHYALAHPDRVTSLAYLSGTGIEWSLWKAAFHQEVDRRLAPDERRRVEALRAAPASRTRDVEMFELQLRADQAQPDRYAGAIGELARVLAAGVNLEVARALNPEVEAIPAGELERRCARMDVPVTIVHGSEDPRPVAAVASLAAALPRCEEHVLDAGHTLWFQRPGRLRRILAAHLRRAERA